MNSRVPLLKNRYSNIDYDIYESNVMYRNAGDFSNPDSWKFQST